MFSKYSPARRLSAIFFGLVLGLSPGVAWTAPVTFQSAVDGSGSAVLELDTDVLVTMTMTPFRLSIKDAAGTPLTGAKVRCELTMPAMAMPENRPKVTEREDGSYGGELIFTCAQGAWRMTCQAEKGDAGSQTMIFDIPKVRMK